MISFVDYQRKNITTKVLLTSEFTQLDCNLKEIKLLPHQKTALSALFDLEKNKKLTIYNCDKYENITNVPLQIESSAIVYTDSFGSGKSYVILALIIINPIPPNKYILDSGDNIKDTVFRADIKRYPLKILRQTLIIVSPPIINQWKNLIETCSAKKVFVVNDYYKLCYFKSRLLDFPYDIVIVKNGLVTYKYEGNKEVKNIISIINDELNNNIAFARVVYDDFDMMQNTYGNYIINALSTIIISSTPIKITSNRSDQQLISLDNSNKLSRIPLNRISNDYLLFNLFNVCCDSKYLTKSTELPKMYFYKYTVKHSCDNLINYIKMLNATDIGELINSDAPQTAAILLGISTCSISDILHKVLQDKYNECANLTKLIKFCNLWLELPCSSNDVLFQVDNFKFLENIPNAISISDQTNIKKLLQILQWKFDLHFRNVNKVLDNLRHGDCQVCLCKIDGAFIFKCCGTITCAICGFKGTNIHIGQSIKGKCVNCATILDVKKDFIYIDKNASIDDICNQNIIPSSQNYSSTKLSILKKILNGHLGENINLNVENLNLGISVLPRPNYMKTIIFASYDESILNIHKFLQSTNIESRCMLSTTKTIDNINWFIENNNVVLLINSYKYCAGISLQNATDLILFHDIPNKHMMSQIIGRIQRIGRTCNARVHILLYSNETI